MRILLAVALAACHPMLPPPVAPLHADTAVAPLDTTTVMVVLGGMINLGGLGYGLAVRVERQETTRTALGLELAGGTGTLDEDHQRHWLLAARTYGRTTPHRTDAVAVVYGAGLSAMAVGAVAATVQLGGAVSYPNDLVSPYFHAGAALALALRRGDRWGDPDKDRLPPRADVFLFGDLGFVGQLAGGGTLSLAGGYGLAVAADEVLATVSVGGGGRAR